ncbi:MAG TPA: ribose 5-phosphate isomerase B [Propioniciclava sp.]|jgi:ribose 5-phosphate isomerase B|uniref:ribose 5-phosphate isomerase B n=1 Tax=Propioniciclava sp. TaxID=2038686 RepID=UPI002C3FDBB5|nr:ribose 5-phosphate isomerase B [Propioniciclava sp.]HRL48294.1 ribose 5-phosphate isomerase B [Propioniciclava sp.]HRL78929.1 ribose 5-phosphate isomerase B [Propioniciclava sp.]
MKIAIGSDSSGAELKDIVVAHLVEAGHEVTDVGWDGTGEAEYSAHYARQVAHLIRDEEAERGVLICGTGIGISISANKVRGIRAAVCSEPFTARHTREHNGSQIIAFGAFVVGPQMACAITDAFLGAEFKGGIFTERFNLIAALEDEELAAARD